MPQREVPKPIDDVVQPVARAVVQSRTCLHMHPFNLMHVIFAHPTTSATSSTACSSTSVPAAAHSGRNLLGLVVRQPIHAGAHHHHRGRDAVDPAGVVAGAADDVHVGIAQLFRGIAARPSHRPGSKVTGSKWPTISISNPTPRLLRHRMGGAFHDLSLHRVQLAPAQASGCRR